MAETAAPTDWDRLRFAFAETDTLYRATGEAGRDPVWDEGEILPFAPLPLSPAAGFFSYGLGVFEGLKARYSADGRVLLFRPLDNALRFQRSASNLDILRAPSRSPPGGSSTLAGFG